MTDRDQRLERIEAILRDHGLHEARCPVRKAQRHNAQGRTYMEPGACTCWLSEHAVDAE